VCSRHASTSRATPPTSASCATLADALYARVDWRWLQDERLVLCHGWTPERGFLRWRWHGYDESLILHALGLGSTTHPLADGAYDAWTATFEWRSVEGIEYLHARSLFIHQMSHLWLDLRGLRDAFMRAHDSDYAENSRCAALVQQRYAIRNPQRCSMYGEYAWGITGVRRPRCARAWPTPRRPHLLRLRGARRPDGPDDGTLAPWAVVASLPFAPDIVLPTIEHFRVLQLHTGNRYGFKASFNATYPADRHHAVGWVSPYHFGINEGPTVLAIANHLDDAVWRADAQIRAARARPAPRGLRGRLARRRAALTTGGWNAQST
jgi:hypothetical protein